MVSKAPIREQPKHSITPQVRSEPQPAYAPFASAAHADLPPHLVGVAQLRASLSHRAQQSTGYPKVEPEGDKSRKSGKTGAGEGIRTLDPNLGKVVLYP